MGLLSVALNTVGPKVPTTVLFRLAMRVALTWFFSLVSSVASAFAGSFRKF